MIERLKNCPNCSGILNEAGRCEYCGSKVFDFLNIDFNGENMPSAQTYIRIKSGDKILLAPVIVPSASITSRPEYEEYTDFMDDKYSFARMSRMLTTIDVRFMVVGDVIQIDSEVLHL